VEYGQRVIDIATHAHLGSDKVAAVAMLRDLELEVQEGSRRCRADHPLEVLAQNLLQRGARAGHKGAAPFMRRLHELQLKAAG